MSEMIFVVMAHTGEYSDHCEWPLIAVRDEARAQAIVSELDEAARVAGLTERSAGGMGDWQARESAMMPFKAAHYPSAEWRHPDYTGYAFDYFAVTMER